MVGRLFESWSGGAQVFSEANGWHAQHERDVCVAYDQEHRAQGHDQVQDMTGFVIACTCDADKDAAVPPSQASSQSDPGRAMSCTRCMELL